MNRRLRLFQVFFKFNFFERVDHELLLSRKEDGPKTPSGFCFGVFSGTKYEDYFHSPTSRPISIGSPTIQFSSNVNYPELAQTSPCPQPRLRAQPHSYFWTRATNGVPQLPTFLLSWLQIQGFPEDPLGLNNLLEQLPELRKVFYLLLLVYFEDYNLEIAKWKQGKRAWVRGDTRVAVPSSGVPLSGYGMRWPAQKLLNPLI